MINGKVINDVTIPGTEVLSSWKEIAAYLRRGVRTAQRWEAELSMPVYRPWGKDHSAVVAMKSEIDLWIRSRSRQNKKSQQLAVAQATNGHISEHHELMASSRVLRADVARARQMLRVSIARLVATLRERANTTSGEPVSPPMETTGSVSI